MKENLKIAIEFTEKLKKIKYIKNIYQVVLFGSVATGEDTNTSDIDIAVIHNMKDKFKLMNEVNKVIHEKIQITYLNIKDLPKEYEMTSALTGEGFLLYGHPINIKLAEKKLKPRVLISYDLSSLSRSDKMKVNRALHGGISRNKYKTKIYETRVIGLVNEPGVNKFSKSVLIIDRKKYAKITNLLKRFNAKWKEVDIMLF